MSGDESERIIERIRQLGRYTRVEEIAAGGMGRVFKAWDEQTSRAVAIKVLSQDARKSKQAIVRFREEVCAAASIRDTHIVTLYDSGELGDTLYYVMEYVDGTPFDQFLETTKLSLKKKVALVASLAKGVAAMHAAGVLHRDLKPGNVLVTRAGEPIIIDLGVAKRLTAQDRLVETKPGTSLGTPLYMPPEQVSYDPEKIGPASDVYSLAVILYHAITGCYPYPAANSALGLGEEPDTTIEGGFVPSLFRDIEETPPISPRHFVPDLPAEVERVILKALSKDPGERHADAGAFVRALEAWIETASALASTTGARRPRPPSLSSEPAARPIPWPAWAVAFLGVATLAAALVVFLNAPRDDKGEPPRPDARALRKDAFAVLDRYVEDPPEIDAEEARKAVGLLEQAAEIKPDKYACCNLAVAHIVLGEFPEARAVLDRAGPGDFMIDPARAWLEREEGRPERAREILGGDPNPTWLAWFVWGLLAEDADEKDEAARCYEKARDKAPWLLPLISRHLAECKK
ncbi:MAG: protein kinase [Planctomycetes bacterium]|nr:protein kinase [Planctomycetota bacterium]